MNWPDCAFPGCGNKCCLALDSKYCWPHTPGTAEQARRALERESQQDAESVAGAPPPGREYYMTVVFEGGDCRKEKFEEGLRDSRWLPAVVNGAQVVVYVVGKSEGFKGRHEVHYDLLVRGS